MACRRFWGVCQDVGLGFLWWGVDVSEVWGCFFLIDPDTEVKEHPTVMVFCEDWASGPVQVRVR